MSTLTINSLSIFSYEYEKIYVGFSGGADSTALLLLLQAASMNSSLNKFKCEAVHFEHGLRGEESKADAKWCRDFCEKHFIPFRMVELGMNPKGENIEAEARRRRLEYWKNTVEPGSEAVALGHHADDNIENLFLRMLRGSNCSGLTALRSVRVIDGVTYVRPLLTYYRSEIEEFLKSQGVTDWRHDSTNAEMLRSRAIIRNALLPEMRRYFPESRKALLKSLDALRMDAEYLEAEAERVFNTLAKGKKRVEIDHFTKLPAAIMFRVLRLWLSSLLGRDFTPTSDLCARFEQELDRKRFLSAAPGEKKILPVYGSSALVFEKGTVSFDRDMATVAIKLDMLPWDWRKTPIIEFGGSSFKAFLVDRIERSLLKSRSHDVVCFDADVFPNILILRLREPGDTMIPFGACNAVAVKKLLEDNMPGNMNKTSFPLVSTPDGNIIWLPGVRRGDFANILENEGDSGSVQGNFVILKCETAARRSEEA